MKKNLFKNKYCLFLFMFFVMLVISGCGEMHFGYTFNEDGSIHAQREVSITPATKRFIDTSNSDIQEWASEDKKNGYKVKSTDNGFESDRTFTSLADLINTNIPLFQSDETHPGIMYRKGFLYDTYDINLYLKGNVVDIPKSSMSPFDLGARTYDDYRSVYEMNNYINNTLQNLIDSAKLDLTFTVPYALDATNAEKVSADKKTVTWNLKPVALDGKDLNANLKFRIYHKNSFIILGVIGVVTLIAGLAFIIIGFKKNEKVFKTVGTLALIAIPIGGAIVYTNLQTPPVLTQSDRLLAENAKDSNGQKLSDTIKKLENTSINSTDEAASLLKKVNITNKITAVSNIDSDGFVALISSDGGQRFVVYNKELNKAAIVYNPREGNLFNLYNKSSLGDTPGSDGYKMYDPFIFNMIMDDNPNSPDKINRLGYIDNSGKWRLPIYVSYGINNSGQYKFNMFASGAGEKPGHYHGTIKDEDNIKLAKTFVTHIDSLKTDVIKKKLDINTMNLW